MENDDDIFIHFYVLNQNTFSRSGCGCGTVDSRGPGFESIHRRLIFNTYLLLVETTNNKEKESGKVV